MNIQQQAVAAQKEYAELVEEHKIILRQTDPEFQEFWKLFIQEIEEKEIGIYSKAESEKANHSLITGQLSMLSFIKKLPETMQQKIEAKMSTKISVMEKAKKEQQRYEEK